MDKEHGKFALPKEAVLELIKMWETNECLYNPKHKFYDNIHARYAALNQMADGLKMFNPAIGPTEIKNKIKHLRGQFTRELAKAKERKSGAGAEELYIPAAYWYYELSFLHDFVKIRNGGCNLYDEKSVRTDDSLDSSLLDFETSSQPSKRPRFSSEMPQTSRTKSQEDSVLTAATSVLENIVSSTKKGNEKVMTFCNYMQAELNDTTNVDMRDELIENIRIVIFEAKKKIRMAKQREYNFDSFEE